MAPTTPTITPDRQRMRERALELLRGVPTKVMTAMLSAIELTCSFHNIVEQYQVLDESLTGDSLLLHAAVSAEDSTQYQFIKLCEDTSRRIANTKEPTTDAQVRALDGTVEGKLIREAMLDEVMSLIENGNVVPRHKSMCPIYTRLMVSG